MLGCSKTGREDTNTVGKLFEKGTVLIGVSSKQIGNLLAIQRTVAYKGRLPCMELVPTKNAQRRYFVYKFLLVTENLYFHFPDTF
jgi:hypothetical protein